MMQRRLDRSCLRTWQSSRAGRTDGLRRSAHPSGDLHPVRIHRYKVFEGYRSHCIIFASVTEIPFTRYFYKYVEIGNAEQTLQDIEAFGRRIQAYITKLFGEV